MKLTKYKENMLDEYTEFWWELYKDRPYVVRLHSPTRVLLHSAGYQYWYLGYSGIWKELQQ